MMPYIPVMENVPAGYTWTSEVVATDETGTPVIEYALAEAIKTEKVVVDYPGEDFYALIWYADSQYVADVWQNRKAQSLVKASTIDELVVCIHEQFK